MPRGRPVGAKGKQTLDARAFVDRVEERLKKSGSAFGMESVAENLLTCGDPKVIAAVWKTMMEYRYGKPKESIEHSGSVGLQIINNISRPQR